MIKKKYFGAFFALITTGQLKRWKAERESWEREVGEAWKMAMMTTMPGIKPGPLVQQCGALAF